MSAKTGTCANVIATHGFRVYCRLDGGHPGDHFYGFDEQPAPKPSTGPEVWPAVIADMQARDKLGRERYGVPLRPGNGRMALRDLYEELLDAVAYTKQEMLERDEMLAITDELARVADWATCEACGFYYGEGPPDVPRCDVADHLEGHAAVVAYRAARGKLP